MSKKKLSSPALPEPERFIVNIPKPVPPEPSAEAYRQLAKSFRFAFEAWMVAIPLLILVGALALAPTSWTALISAAVAVLIGLFRQHVLIPHLYDQFASQLDARNDQDVADIIRILRKPKECANGILEFIQLTAVTCAAASYIVAVVSRHV